MSHTTRRTAPLVFAALLLAAALFPTTASPVAADGGSSFVSVANGYRAGEGLGPVALHAAIDQIAVERGRQLVEDGELGHDFDYLTRRFAELGVCWSGFGEIVAYNGTGEITRFGQQWWNSDPHRAIMLGNYTHAGGSREDAGDGRWYGVMVFVRLCGQSTTSGGFTDTASSAFRTDIAWLVQEGITAGCTSDRYCPKDAVTREQMASFIKRAAGVPETAGDWFRDDDRSVHEGDINRIAAARIAAGCANARYCPADGVTRGQMASFLVRTLNLPAATRDWFSDDNGTPHEGSINRLAEAGVTGGCATGRFCPNSVVTREQMAGFLHRAFGP